jgi:glutamate racemase
MKIGVFDSGIGGESVLHAARKALFGHEFIFRRDTENLPYGTKTPEQLLELVSPIIQEMVDQGCQVIVIACNSATTTIISDLRKSFDIPFVGIEPMVKPAAKHTKTNVIAVCATPLTLASRRYAHLVEKYASRLTIIEPDCSQWAYMIEQNKVDHDIIKEQIIEVCQKGADVIVLGCTHYHWIEQDIKSITEGYGAIVIQPEEAVVRQLKRVIARLG